MERYFSNEIKSGDLHLTLDEQESRHCISVMRHQEGDVIELCNGQGSVFDAKIVQANSRKTAVDVIGERFVEHPTPSLHIAISPTKNASRFEWFVEKAAELGVHRITPLVTKRTEKSRVQRNRLEKKLVSAIKQSGNPWMPQLDDPITITKFMITSPARDTEINKLIATCADVHRLPLHSVWDKRDVCLMIGPEGDFSESEILEAEQCGFTAVSMGELRLRTETAGLYAALAFNIGRSITE